MKKTDKGKIGEDIAVSYLKRKGYEVLARNFKTEVGEIDIVAADTGYLVFVEVKLRKNEDFGFPSEAVNALKIKKISHVASQYLESFMLSEVDVRFDIIEVLVEDKSVNHIENAFDSFLRY